MTDWWESYVYLYGRSSIMINSNYYAGVSGVGVCVSVRVCAYECTMDRAPSSNRITEANILS